MPRSGKRKLFAREKVSWKLEAASARQLFVRFAKAKRNRGSRLPTRSVRGLPATGRHSPPPPTRGAGSGFQGVLFILAKSTPLVRLRLPIHPTKIALLRC